MLRTTAILIAATVAMGIELTPDTWETETAGKTVFLKFFAPWCGHCKAMKPDWDTLMTEYQDSSTVLVADVDCIGSGKDLCTKFGVKGFPTVKFGDPVNLEDYKGGRDLVTLQKFTSELKPSCNIETFEYCSEKEKSTIAIIKNKSVEDLKASVEEEADERKAVETLFETSVKRLQAEYQDGLTNKDTSLQEIATKYNIGIVKSILNTKESSFDKKSEL